MKRIAHETIQITIFIAGDLETAKGVCRAWAFNVGACVTVEPCSYIYTGGQEEGVRVGLINYPRFPSTQTELAEKAEELALVLMKELYQHSCSVVTPDETIWLSRRVEV